MNDETYMKAMFGTHAVHAPCWAYFQDMGQHGVMFVGASECKRLTFGGSKAQQLFLGEIVARPHFVVESEIYRAYGATGLVTSDKAGFLSSPDMQILCDPMGKVREFMLNVEDSIKRQNMQ